MKTDDTTRTVEGPLHQAVKPLLTDWFPPDVHPVRDGVYLTSEARLFGTLRSECWHAMRWSAKTQSWYSAASTGDEYEDLIGADHINRRSFWWRGLAA